MATSEDKSLALELQTAKTQLESQIENLLNMKVDRLTEPIEIDLTQEAEDYKHRLDQSLIDDVKSLAEDFHNRPAVQRADVHVHKITAVDSDGDGRLAVDVSYDHRAY